MTPTGHPSPVTYIQSLVQLALVKKTLFRFERAGVQNPDQPAIRPICAENSDAARRHAEIEKPGLSAEARRVGQQPDGERILKGLFYFPLSQRTTHFEGRIIPIKLHIGLIVNKTPMQCDYIVFTHRCHVLSIFLFPSQKQSPFETVVDYSSPPPGPPPLIWVIMAISGRNMAITMLPTITARATIMIGSRREVMAATELSTSSS